VQLASLAWLVARIDPSAPGASGLNTVFTTPATLVISGSALNPLHPMAQTVHIRAVAFSRSPDDAHAIADKVNVFVALSHAAETSVGTHGTDADVKALFDSLQIKQEGEHVVLTAAMPFGFLRKMLSGSAPELAEPSDAPAPQVPAKSR
jgi:hypothetical protein